MRRIGSIIGSSNEPNKRFIRLIHQVTPDDPAALDLATARLAPLALAGRGAGAATAGLPAGLWSRLVD